MKIKIQFEIDTEDGKYCGSCNRWKVVFPDEGKPGDYFCDVFSKGLSADQPTNTNPHRCPACLKSEVKAFWKPIEEMKAEPKRCVIVVNTKPEFVKQQMSFMNSVCEAKGWTYYAEIPEVKP